MSNNDYKIYGLDLMAGVFTAIQSEHVFQIISLILTCIATFLSIVFTIWKWFKKAYEDKNITIKEIEELEKQLKEELEKERNQKE